MIPVHKNYPHPSRRDSGFSLIECLISLSTFMAVTLGILPMFMKSIDNNDSGNGYLQSTNFARSVMEEFQDLPFNAPELTIPAGQNELVVDTWWSMSEEVWKTGTPSATDALWTRTTTVRQFSSADLDDNGQLDTPLPGGSSTDFVHLKEISVIIDSTREGGPLGTGKSLALRHLKTF